MHQNGGGDKPIKTGKAVNPSGKKLSLERKISIISVLIATLSFAGCTFLSLYELTQLDYSQALKNTGLGKKIPGLAEKEAGGKLGGDSFDKRKAPVKMLNFLPLKMKKEYNTEARQNVPGQEDYSVEAIYGPTDKFIIPYNCYVKITYFTATEDALEIIKRNRTLRYPNDAGTTVRNNIKVYTSYEEKHAGYYLATIIDKYLLEIQANYLAAIPGEKESNLEQISWEVFDEVSERMLSALKR